MSVKRRQRQLARALSTSSEDDNVSLYETLGVSKTASDAEIKASYYKMAIANHPETTETETRDRYDEIAFAYKILGDRRRRAVYDLFGRFGVDVAEKYGYQLCESRWFKCILLGLMCGLCFFSLCCCCCCCCNCCCGCCGACTSSEGTSAAIEEPPLTPLKDLEEMQRKEMAAIVAAAVTTPGLRNVDESLEYIDAPPTLLSAPQPSTPTVVTCKITRTP